jgi:hypothetical protein
MTTEFSTVNVWARLNDILACALAAVSATAAGPPQRACIIPGEVVWDDCSCGMLVVNWRAVGRSNVFPASASETSQTNCLSGYTTLQVGVTMLRCAAGPAADAEMPTCAALSDDAFVMTADMTAIRAGLTCCLRTMYDQGNLLDYALGNTVSLGPLGGCDGSLTDLIIGFAGGGCCA